MNIDRNAYLSMRRRYEPDVVRLVIIAESPPASGLYCYNPTGATNEWLFRALMQQLAFLPVNKESGLLEFQRRGTCFGSATWMAGSDALR